MVGYGHIRPVQNIEMVFAMAVAATGTAFQCLIVAAVTSAVVGRAKVTATRETRQLQLKAFLRQEKIDKSMSDELLAMLDYQDHRFHSLEEASIINDLPTHLRADVVRFLIFDSVSHHRLLRQVSEDTVFMNCLLPLMQPLTLPPHTEWSHYGR